jgi:hypothetical protein
LKKLLLLTLIVIGCQRNSSNPIKFQSEEIRMSVDSSRVSIAATYYFKNDSTQLLRARIFYPFPIDEYHYYPDSIVVLGLDYTQNDSGIDLAMKFEPACIETLNIFYQQKLKGNQARYILTTTKHWKNPLQQSSFIIDIPDNLQNLEMSYLTDSIIQKDSRKYYYLTKRNFMPEQDLVIKWESYK